jgi:hypothetical protein
MWFCSSLLCLPHPTSLLEAELPNQLWEHLFIPTVVLWGQLSLIRLWPFLAAGHSALSCSLGGAFSGLSMLAEVTWIPAVLLSLKPALGRLFPVFPVVSGHSQMTPYCKNRVCDNQGLQLLWRKGRRNLDMVQNKEQLKRSEQWGNRKRNGS